MATVHETPTDLRPAADASGRLLLREVPWDAYMAIREPSGNDHMRMTYHDGVLEIMSPGPLHERGSRRLDQVVLAVAVALDIACSGVGSTTFRRKGDDPRRGSGKEPDQGFYVAHEALVRDKDEIDLDVDPPPDLAIEVDDTTDSDLKMLAYAALRVPEVWIYEAREERLRFLRLGEDGTFTEIASSLSFPMLSPALVLEGMQVGHGLPETRRLPRLGFWARETFGPPPADAGA